uniref:Uncharacterized protein n=1 Tax=Fagus sylvatica TaxID=28930 RepID=A0A2N9ENJ9_FAGSY
MFPLPQWVEGGLVLGGIAHDNVQLRLGGELEILQSEEHLARISTTVTTPIGGAGTSIQGPSLSSDLDYKGWLGGDFEGYCTVYDMGFACLAWLYSKVCMLGMALSVNISGLTPVCGPKNLNSEGSGLTPVRGLIAGTYACSQLGSHPGSDFFLGSCIALCILGSVDLVPTIEEYTELLLVPSSSTWIYMPIQRYRTNRELANTLGLRYEVVNPEVCKAGLTWRHASISFDFLASQFSRSQCPWDHIGDFINDLGIVPLVDSLSRDLSIFPALVSETVRSLSYYPIISCEEHDQAFEGVWGCAGYYPSLALRQFGGLQHLPRINDLSPVTFVYTGGTSMLDGIAQVAHYWSCQVTEVDFVDLDSPSDDMVTPEFLRWREEWGSSFLPRSTFRPALEEVRDELRVDRAVQRESEPYYMVQSLKRQGTVDFVLDLLQSSEDAGGTLESTLADTQTRMEEEQLVWTPTRDELDLLLSYTQSLIDSSIVHPHDIVCLRRIVRSCSQRRTLCNRICESGPNMPNVEHLQLLRSLHQVTRVAQSVGVEATVVLGGVR